MDLTLYEIQDQVEPTFVHSSLRDETTDDDYVRCSPDSLPAGANQTCFAPVGLVDSMSIGDIISNGVIMVIPLVLLSC